ncbi:MAG: DUF2959 domain-containing protein [Desulfobulbaceae bacterium]|nr:DUF2959 domain-containing protein [Desulfobulbaceae bacterium]
MKPSFIFSIRGLLILMLFVAPLAGCSSAYYGMMEKVGVHKRDILVARVEGARDSQAEAQEQFKSALEKFQSVVQLEDTDLKIAYENLNFEYEKSKEASDAVADRIERVEDVAEDLFEEWEDELVQYRNNELREKSKQQLDETNARYQVMHRAMRRAKDSMAPVMQTLHDNVLYLKHNLNAQAIGSLRNEFSTLRVRIDDLIKRMNESIETSNKFIDDLK